MTQNEDRSTDEQTEVEKGPTEKLRELERPTADTLIHGTEIPGVQNPESDEIKDEKNLNTE